MFEWIRWREFPLYLCILKTMTEKTLVIAGPKIDRCHLLHCLQTTLYHSQTMKIQKKKALGFVTSRIQGFRDTVECLF